MGDNGEPKKKVIVFDFDETLTMKDTTNDFFFSVNNDEGIIRALKLVIYFFCRILTRLRIISIYQLKLFGVLVFIKRYSKETIESESSKFYNKIKFNDNVISILREEVNNGNTVIISSASFNEYVCFINREGADILTIGSELKYLDNHVVGIKSHNYEGNKLDNLNYKRIDELYTDSLSDLSLATIAQTIFLVKNSGDIIECNSVEQFRREFE